MQDRYNPAEVEDKNYKFWMDKNYFSSVDLSTKPPFSIILPPPNVTGALHMGHALDHTIQDTLTRWKRMSGFNTLWLPGTDHAGIATQTLVEKELIKNGLNKKSLGREGFLKKVWQWKEEYGGRILEQMKKLGDSVDWSRLRFTLDEGVSKAVRKVFVELYKQNLIYRGQRLVNWDTQLETAVSDLEVEHEERKGTLWHIKYKFFDSNDFLVVATTRPETLLGDTAICVNPNDERYKKFIGKKVILPLLNREIPIIADDYVDPAFGSGVVKITPAHDFNDYEIGKRHKLSFINILNPNGTLNENAGPYTGMKMQPARKKILEDLITKELLFKEEPYKQIVPICSRTNQAIEPYLSNQWFVSINKLATPARRVVENESISFVPESWAKTYLHWLNNIEDWCISRQLWWGHRIPAWHCQDCAHITVSEIDPPECENCRSKKIVQDEDVLDTWFSSGLWPFSTLGWPEKTEALKTFYPTNVLVTGHDIIFFWVARMIMSGIHFAEDIPFRTVYIHGLVRDSQGKKMSKSVGNTVDPLEVIEKYGADALRFTILSQIATGKDLKFNEKRLESSRNFMNKIWNATRFALTHLTGLNDKTEKLPDPRELSLADHWIISQLKKTEISTTDNLENYRFSDAANTLYSFVWNDFCDWYLEFIKPIVYETDSAQKQATLKVLAITLNRVMRLLHPFIPFITEELYQKLPIKSEAAIIDTYPTVENDKIWFSILDENRAFELTVLKETISAIRNIRGENQIKPGQKINVKLSSESSKLGDIINKNHSAFKKMANADNIEIGQNLPATKSAVSLVQIEGHKLNVIVPLEGLVDFGAEVTRLQKNLDKIKSDINITSRKLSDDNFVKNAPADIVETEKLRINQLNEQLKTIQDNLKRLN